MKIKAFLQNNKKEIKGIGLTVGMLVIGIYIGKKNESTRLDNMLDNLARTGRTVNNFVDGKEYVLSVTEKIKE